MTGRFKAADGKNSRVANPHRGARFEVFLDEAGLPAAGTATAQARVLAWQFETAMRARGLTRAALARRMGTSPAALACLLDPECDAMTLRALVQVAMALGMEVEVTIENAA